MARPLPVSLSPHICIQTSPDLDQLLASRSLPPLPEILQAFAPVSQVNTRTSSLTTVSHAAFNLRFSSLADIESACKEDSARRAVRIIDWISERITRQCSSWVDALDRERNGGSKFAAVKGEDAGAGAGLRVVDEAPPTIPSTSPRTPWWDDVKRCVEGDCVPTRTEGWNHPTSIITAISTNVPNPLQSITTLNSRPSELPAWVDPTRFQYIVVIHPEDSLLSPEETNALFNAIRKQYGLNTYLLRLRLPAERPAPVAVPAMLPRLPTQFTEDGPVLSRASSSTVLDGTAESAGRPNTLSLHQDDIQETGKFLREFVNQGLVPWMERAVIEWNETYASSRRLPSRLFSSTRRLFGTSTPTPPPPSHQRSSTLTQAALHNSSVLSTSTSSSGGALGEQRRLAEFATILGDYKLATNVWETLRKDGKGGSDIIPILVAAGPGVQLHAQHALSSLASSAQSEETPPHVLFAALRYTARWVESIPLEDFISDVLEGERWLVWAAGNAEDAPSAILLAHAAHLSTRKRSKRKASLLYLTAANRLEKCGIKPLTMHFLAKAQELYTFKIEKDLSPSFWEVDERKPDDWEGFQGIRPGINHALARLLYTSGQVEEAVRLYLSLLAPVHTASRWSDPGDLALLNAEQHEQVLLNDFDVAFKHLLSKSGYTAQLENLRLPFTFTMPRETKIRLPRDTSASEQNVWTSREESWRTFWKPRGSEQLRASGKAALHETFWIELQMTNPLNVDVTLANLTVTVHESGTEEPSSNDLADVEVLSSIILDARETRTIPLSITAKRQAKILFSEVRFDFLSLLPCAETLQRPGPRLHATAIQRQGKDYGPDVPMTIETETVDVRLSASFVEDDHLSLLEGECKMLQLWLSNEGSKDIAEVYLVKGGDDEILLQSQASKPGVLAQNVAQTTIMISSLSTVDYPLQLTLASPLTPNQHVTADILLHAGPSTLDAQLDLLVVYREDEASAFHSTRVTRSFEVTPFIGASITATPSRTRDHLYSVNVHVTNPDYVNEGRITDVITVSPSWTPTPITSGSLLVLPEQDTSLAFEVDPWNDGQGLAESEAFVKKQLTSVVQGQQPARTYPPSLELLCFRAFTLEEQPSISYDLLQNSRQKLVRQHLKAAHPRIPQNVHGYIFPLYHPSTLDCIVEWDVPSQQRHGYLVVQAGELGASHSNLRDVFSDVKQTATARSMYAETQTERQEMLDAVERSIWNMEMNPVVVTVPDKQITHDFAAQGACHVPASFVVRNFSRTHTSRFVLKLPDISQHSSGEHLLLPRFAGRRIFRGELPPFGVVELQPQVWIGRPGVYSLSGWAVETEVGEQASGSWQTLFRYKQSSPAGDRSSLIVSDTE